MTARDPLPSPPAPVLLDLLAELRAVNERLTLSNLNERTFADLAEKKRLQLSALLESLHDGIVIANQKWGIVMLNASARRIVALPPEGLVETTSRQVLDLRQPDMSSIPAAEQPLERAMRGEAVVDTEYALVTARGDVRRILTHCTSIADEDEGALAIMVLQDITERRRLEARVVQSERLSAVGALASGFAHEINNPLSYAVGNIELALEELRASRSEGAPDRSSEVEAMLVAAQHGVDRVSKIVRELRTLAPPQGEPPACIDLRPLLETAASTALESAARPIRLVKHLGSVPLVNAVDSRLGQVFVNLLTNAVESFRHDSAPRDEISLTTSTDADGNAVVEIADTGNGIPDAALPRIFEPFFTTKKIGAGLGLGLFTCRNVVLAMGGQLTAESAVGRGTRLRVTLPASGIVEPTPSERARAAPPSPTDPEPSGRRGTVLVIDDEPALGLALQRMLRAHDVSVVSGAKEALALLDAGRAFDVILCDLMMPVMTGMQLYEGLEETSPHVVERFVFMTGGTFTAAGVAFLKRVPNPCLEKPFDVRAVRSLVGSRIRAQTRT